MRIEAVRKGGVERAAARVQALVQRMTAAARMAGVNGI